MTFKQLNLVILCLAPSYDYPKEKRVEDVKISKQNLQEEWNDTGNNSPSKAFVFPLKYQTTFGKQEISGETSNVYKEKEIHVKV